MVAEMELWAETAANATRLALTAQLALSGQLASVLVASGALPAQQASEMLTKIADMIGASVDDGASDLQAILIAPVREHADALRRLAGDLQKFSGPNQPD